MRHDSIPVAETARPGDVVFRQFRIGRRRPVVILEVVQPNTLPVLGDYRTGAKSKVSFIVAKLNSRDKFTWVSADDLFENE